MYITFGNRIKHTVTKPPPDRRFQTTPLRWACLVDLFALLFVAFMCGSFGLLVWYGLQKGL